MRATRMKKSPSLRLIISVLDSPIMHVERLPQSNVTWKKEHSNM